MKTKFFLPCLFLIFTLSACTSNLQQTKFYLLPSPDFTATDTKTESRIGILPIGIPPYLQRPQMILREDEKAQVRIDEFHRWAEGLDDAFQRVLGVALTNELASVNTTVMPLRIGFPVDYKLSVDVRAFEGDIQKNVILDAYWTLQENSKIMIEGHFKESMPTSTRYQNLVNQQSALIESMAKNIAQTIQEFYQKGK